MRQAGGRESVSCPRAAVSGSPDGGATDLLVLYAYLVDEVGEIRLSVVRRREGHRLLLFCEIMCLIWPAHCHAHEKGGMVTDKDTKERDLYGGKTGKIRVCVCLLSTEGTRRVQSRLSV